MNKLKGLRSFDSYLNEQYGEENSVERKEFEAKAKAWYLNNFDYGKNYI